MLKYQFFCFFNPFKDFFSSGQHRPLVFAYCLIVSDQTVKIKVFHISGPLLPLVLQLLQVEANIPNILVHTNSAEQRDDFLQTPNSQAKYTIKDGGSSRTFCPHVGGGHGWERGGGRLLVHRVDPGPGSMCSSPEKPSRTRAGGRGGRRGNPALP